MSTPTIPMSGDVASLIGSAAQHVENRSLLLDKFVFHKRWPEVEEVGPPGGDYVKWDEATRWSFMRIADGAAQILSREAEEKRRKANGKNVKPQNRDRFMGESKIADALAAVKWDSKELHSIRTSHSRHWLGLLRKAYGDRYVALVGELEGRLAINLADSLIQNAGICLDRIFGLPFIPGSAIKGVCRHAALAELKSARGEEVPRLLDHFCSVFGIAEVDLKSGDLKPFWQQEISGDTNRKGAVSFLPAYPVNEARIVVDLTNVHYPDYYRTGKTEDLSKERPRLNPFPAVEVGAQFAFGLVLNDANGRPEVLAAAKRWLEVALVERGLGAKTAAGYGWFSIKSEALEKLLVEFADEEKKQKELEETSCLEPSAELMARFGAMKDTDLAGILNKYALDTRFWPKDSTVHYELSLFEFIKAKAIKLAGTKNGKKAMTFLAQKLNRPLP
jgi:CRISPR type III-B/RAMP module RAMP protein Cmr6